MIQSRGNYIDGQWTLPRPVQGDLVRHNPSRLGEVVYEGGWSVQAVEEAVGAAGRAFGGWDRLGFAGRLEVVGRFGGELEAREEEIARCIASEAGKPMWEARTEAKALRAKIEIMSQEGMTFVQEHQPQGLAGRTLHRPLGPLAILGPFNFPLHLPNGHIIPALLTGNTVVIKPSELTPGCMQLYVECAHQAGFPPGVINMVQGPGAVGAALVTHGAIRGILFTGSYETGLRIKEATLHDPSKLLALEMGGKNTSIVLDDANLDQAAHEIVQSAYLTCGQRCTATSRVVVQESVIEPLVERITALTRRVTTGDALTEAVFMGPLINQAAFERFLQAQEDDEGGNLSPILKGARARPELQGHFVSPGLWLVETPDEAGSHQSKEIFGPDVVFYRVAGDEEAAAVANATPYGLAMSVFGSRERYDRMIYALETGILNWNKSTAGASSRLPFGGVKRSGNHRPAAIWAALYCTYPQAQLHQATGFDPAQAQAPPFDLLEPVS